MLHHACLASLFIVTVNVPARAVAQTIRGTVFDSLTMKPLGGAVVWVQGGSQTTIANSEGRFELRDVSPGPRFVAFSSPGVDCLGMGTLGSIVSSSGGQRVSLATPSFRTLWRRLCAAQAAGSDDSGITWGTIRDAQTDIRLSGARVMFEWTQSTIVGGKLVSIVRASHEARSDSTGTYYACGLPTGMDISAEGSGAQSSTATIIYGIGERRVRRIDLLVSTEMIPAAQP